MSEFVRGAEAYDRRGVIYVHASSLTGDGLRVTGPPFFAIPGRENRAISDAVRAALQGSQPSNLLPYETRGIADPLYALAGVKTWRAFSASARHVSIRQRHGNIEMIPWIDMGGVDPFQQAAQPAAVVPEATELIGDALLAAFDACER